MRKRNLIVIGIAAVLFLWCAIPASARVDIGFFHQELDPYGDWVQVSHGWGWVPRDVPPGWRPYTTGHWVYTEEGPLWAADEAWGAIPFHYGRWFFDSRYGWAWIPGGEWAPAWVVWRNGGGYLGWAPLTPEVGWSQSSGLVWGGFAFNALDPLSWVFVPEREIFAPSIIRVAVLPPRNITIIRQTKNITNVAVDRERVVDRSFSPQSLSRWVGRQVTPLRLDELKQPSRGRGLEIREKEKDVRVYRPNVTVDIKMGPPPKPQLPPDKIAPPRPAQKDLEMLQEKIRIDRQELERQHKMELTNPPPMVRPEELRKGQQEEMDYLDRSYQRENNRLEQRLPPGKDPGPPSRPDKKRD